VAARRGSRAVVFLVALSLGCAGAWPGETPLPQGEREGPQRYRPDRRDYASFTIAHPGLPEPNYLPFMVHRFARPGGLGDALILCRFDSGQMPIRVWVEPPVFDPSVQNEFAPVRAEAYVGAVDQALAVWQDALEGLVAFERVDRRERASLHIDLIGREAPLVEGGRRRLGAAEKLVDACRTTGWDPDADRLQVRFDLLELVIHLADDSGLLPPTIVRRLVVHELGHALGMRGHSPSPGDVMYPELSDAPGRDELSIQDVNSFVALYSVPNGAHFVDAPQSAAAAPRPPPVPPSGGPQVDKAPYVDVAHGFELSVPQSWIRIEEPHGVFFSDGPTWDHDASLRIFVWPSPSIEAFMACCTRELLATVWYRHSEELDLDGHRALRLMVEDDAGERASDLLIVELDDRRVMLIATECPTGYEDAWRPWFDESLATLEVWDDTSRRRLLGADGPGGIPSRQ
jgi:predicted Zn-dependent protease